MANVTRDDLQQELMIAMLAARELPADSLEPLSDELARRLREELSTSDRAILVARHRFPLLAQVEGACAVLAALLGVFAAAYCFHAMAVDESVLGPHGTYVADTLTTIQPYLLVVVIAAISLIIAAYLHVLRGLSLGRWLLVAATAAMTAVAVPAVLGFGSIVMEFAINSVLPVGFVPALSALTLTLAFLACLVAWSPRSSDRL